LGDVLVWLGEFAAARAHLQQEMALYDPQQHRSPTVLYGEDLGVVCLSYTALVQWLLGYPDQALRSTHEALTRARDLSHPFSLARALFWAARLHQMRREAQAVQEHVEALWKKRESASGRRNCIGSKGSCYWHAKVAISS
jgi:hypothetical protein